MKKLAFATISAAVMAFGVAGSASADTWFLNLSEAHDGLDLPYGQVDVIESGTDTLQYTVTLFDGLKFVQTGNHYPFSFSLDGAPTLTFSGPAGFTLIQDEDDIKNAPFDGFDYALNCSVCAPSGGGVSGPLVFTVSAAGLTLDDVAASTKLIDGQAVLFAADAIRNGATGTVGGGTPGTPGVPEPATWAMMILGFGGVGALMRRRRMEMTAV